LDEFNLVVEIPEQTVAKMEISTSIKHHPIVQDLKKNPEDPTGEKILRDYAIKPVFNYGAIPMTWEDPKRFSVNPQTGEKYFGDGDPLDIVEISGDILKPFEVYKVRVLGSLMLIDSGEVDWKVLGVNVDSSFNKEVKDIADLRHNFPEKYSEIVEWFRMYKVYEGKRKNVFLREDEDIGVQETLKIIQETHEDWIKRVKEELEGPLDDFGVGDL